MKNTKTYLALLLGLVFATPAFAQARREVNVLGISDSSSAVDLDVALYVKYVGTAAPSTTTTVAVASNGDITLTVAGTDDVSVRCPFGGTAGIIDVSDAECNTFGEVIDAINRSGNWIAAPRTVLRSDSSDDTLATLSASTNVLNVGGAGLLRDTDVAKNFTVALNTKGNGNDIRDFVSGTSGTQASSLRGNPLKESRQKLFGITANATFGSGTNTITVYGVARDFNVPKGTSVIAPTAAATAVYSEVVRTIWTEAGAATTVEFTRRFFEVDGLDGNPGEQILVREATSASSTPSAGYLAASGRQLPERP